MKRKAPSSDSSSKTRSKRAKQTPTATEIHSRFRPDLFSPTTLAEYTKSYANSEPYRHGVIPSLIADPLLRSVRSEILTHISFTPKETDIYKIHQSGDLANLDGLPDDALSKLPSLLELRDALYSQEFRNYLEEITGAGKLSGMKTDMAVNVYMPGCFLLCHDDVIGTRRLSYILYLTDPDKEWKKEWGGGLRLYPTQEKTNNKKEKVKVPSPDHSLVIPPSFGQLSFFKVEPGESFHDVEEVYHRKAGEEDADDGGRMRMAISGWYHIPQDGEDGYEPGLEEKLAEKSSLAQLQGAADEFDNPKEEFRPFRDAWGGQAPKHLLHGLQKDAALELEAIEAKDPTEFTTTDFEFLLQFISPSYLTPDMMDELAESFSENSFLQLDAFLKPDFAARLHDWLSSDQRDHTWSNIPGKPSAFLDDTAVPPHKHRFIYARPDAVDLGAPGHPPMLLLLNDLLPSNSFRKWLAFATGLAPSALTDNDTMLRQFRAGKDYALATTYPADQSPRLEYTLGLTAAKGWEDADEGNEDGDEDEGEDGNDDDEEEVPTEAKSKTQNGTSKSNPKSKSVAQSKPKPNPKSTSELQPKTNGTTTTTTTKATPSTPNPPLTIDLGGEEVYMAADDDHPNAGVDANNPNPHALPNTGKSDPAIYRSSNNNNNNPGGEEDDSILFTAAPAWNRLSIVLRDGGTMRFVKYVSRAAEGHRWDVKGVVRVEEGAWDDADADAEADADGDGNGDGDGDDGEADADGVGEEATTEDEDDDEDEDSDDSDD